MNKKIALVLDGVGIGGIEKVAADYSRLFNNLGYKIYIINLNPSENYFKNKFPENVKFIDFRFCRKESPEQYAQLIKSGRWWGRFCYPVVYALLSFWLFLKKGYFRCIYSYLEEFDIAISFSSHFNDLTFVAKDFLRSSKKMSWSHGALYGYALISDGYLNLYNQIKNLVVLVDDAQQETLVYNKQLKLNIHKLYNPVYIENDLQKQSSNIYKKKYGDYLLMVARFSYPHKDHYTVLKAFKEVLQKYPTMNLVFVGDGPEFNKVTAFAQSLGKDVYEHTFFVGAQSNVRPYYSGAKMLIHASVAGEGLPTVILEALANGIPVVSTDSKVGPREILGNNEYGLLTKVRDSKDMSEKILSLIESPELYEMYKNKSLQRAKNFTPETIEKRLKKVLQAIV